MSDQEPETMSEESSEEEEMASPDSGAAEGGTEPSGEPLSGYEAD